MSSFFYPQNSPRSFRTTELVKEFARTGHKVTLIVPKDDKKHIPFEEKYNIIIKDLGKQKFKDIKFKSNTNKVVLFLKRVLRRSLLLFLEYPDIELMLLVKRALKKEKNYDLLISIAAPHTIHWGVAWAWRNNTKIAKTWIADCGDPFMGVTTDTFKKLFYFKYVENFWCRQVDYITVPFLGAMEGYYKEYRNKISVIPQGFNFDDIKINAKGYIPNKIPTFAYAGYLIPGARDPRPLINYLLSLNIEFKFIFYTQSLSLLSEYSSNLKGKIIIRDYIPRNELLQELAKMDFVVNFNNGVMTQLPSKLIDYYLTKRPVLSLDSYSFDKETVKQFLGGEYSNKFEYKNPEQYRIENVAQQFLKLTN